MRERNQKLFLNDIIESIEHINQFVKDLTYESFHTDEKTKSAVLRKIEVMGEAVKNLSPGIIAQNKNIPWSLITKMRDKVIHGYFGVDYRMVWETIHKDYPELLKKIKLLYNSIKG